MLLFVLVFYFELISPTCWIKLFSIIPSSVPPLIVPFSFGEDPVNTGENAGVQCMIQKGDVPITIKWTLNSRPIINGEDGITILKLSAKTSVLNIGSVDQYHRGFFKCIAENMAGSTFSTAELKVNGTNLKLYLPILVIVVLLVLS